MEIDGEDIDAVEIMYGDELSGLNEDIEKYENSNKMKLKGGGK